MVLIGLFSEQLHYLSLDFPPGQKLLKNGLLTDPALPKKNLASRLIGYIFDWRQAKMPRCVERNRVGARVVNGGGL